MPPPPILPAIPPRDGLSYALQMPPPPPANDNDVNGFEDDLDEDEEFKDSKLTSEDYEFGVRVVNYVIVP